MIIEHLSLVMEELMTIALMLAMTMMRPGLMPSMTTQHQMTTQHLTTACFMPYYDNASTDDS